MKFIIGSSKHWETTKIKETDDIQTIINVIRDKQYVSEAYDNEETLTKCYLDYDEKFKNRPTEQELRNSVEKFWDNVEKVKKYLNYKGEAFYATRDRLEIEDGFKFSLRAYIPVKIKPSNIKKLIPLKELGFDTAPYGRTSQKINMIGCFKPMDKFKRRLIPVYILKDNILDFDVELNENNIKDYLITYVGDDYPIVEYKEKPKVQKIEKPVKESSPECKNIINIIEQFIKRCYKKERAENQREWYEFICAVQSLGEENANYLSDIFSNLSSKFYDYEENQKYYETARKNSNRDNKLTYRSCFLWAKEDNLIAFKEIINENQAIMSADKFNHNSVAKQLKCLLGDKVLYRPQDKDNVYFFNNKTWTKSPQYLTSYISNELTDFLEMTYKCDDKKDMRKLNSLGQTTFKKCVIEELKECAINEEVDFDLKNVFAFKNGVYDLKTNEFREQEATDYCLMSCGYNYIPKENCEENITEFNELLDTIIRTKEEQEFYLNFIATGFYPKNPEKALFNTGSGGNGKGLLMEIVKTLFGDYYAKADKSLFSPKNEDSERNVALCNLTKKRFVNVEEVKTEISSTIFKDITGGAGITARQNFSNDTSEKKNFMSLLIQSNNMPKFSDMERSGLDSLRRRTYQQKFYNKFTDNKDYVNEEEHIYLSRPELKDPEKIEFLSLGLLHRCLQIIQNGNPFKPTIPDKITKLSDELVNGSNTFLNWFNENYERTENKKDFIIINNIVDDFKCSEEYNDMSKNEQKDIKKNKIISMFQNDIFYSKFFKKDTKKDDKRYKNILNNFIRKDTDSDEE